MGKNNWDKVSSEAAAVVSHAENSPKTTVLFGSLLIFDSFKSVEDAETFISAMNEKYGLAAGRCETQEESDRFNPFPFPLVPPIVLVERPRLENGDIDERLEREIEAFVSGFHCVFCGT